MPRSQHHQHPMHAPGNKSWRFQSTLLPQNNYLLIPAWFSIRQSLHTEPANRERRQTTTSNVRLNWNSLWFACGFAYLSQACLTCQVAACNSALNNQQLVQTLLFQMLCLLKYRFFDHFSLFTILVQPWS